MDLVCNLLGFRNKCSASVCAQHINSHPCGRPVGRAFKTSHSLGIRATPKERVPNKVIARQLAVTQVKLSYCETADANSATQNLALKCMLVSYVLFQRNVTVGIPLQYLARGICEPAVINTSLYRVQKIIIKLRRATNGSLAGSLVSLLNTAFDAQIQAWLISLR